MFLQNLNEYRAFDYDWINRIKFWKKSLKKMASQEELTLWSKG